MTKEEKLKTAIEKGFTYNKETGQVFGVKGNPLSTISKDGYLRIMFVKNSKAYYLFHHQFAYYFIYHKTPNCIDHINMNKLDNRICNLRDVSKQENCFNSKAKGITFNKRQKRYISRIMIDGKRINLGYFEKEEEANSAYLQAKNIYHKIIKK